MSPGETAASEDADDQTAEVTSDEESPSSRMGHVFPVWYYLIERGG